MFESKCKDGEVDFARKRYYLKDLIIWEMACMVRGNFKHIEYIED